MSVMNLVALLLVAIAPGVLGRSLRSHRVDIVDTVVQADLKSLGNHPSTASLLLRGGDVGPFSVGMSVKVTADDDLFQAACGALGIIPMVSAGDAGKIKEIDLKDGGSVLLVTSSGDEGWVPIKALVGFGGWGDKKAVKKNKKEVKQKKKVAKKKSQVAKKKQQVNKLGGRGSLSVGMRVKVIADEKVYEALCDAKGIIAMVSAGDKGTVKEIAKDGTALVATEGGDEGWVPIKALKGFESWGSKKAAKKKKHVQLHKKKVKELRMSTGMIVKIVPDKQQYAKECAASAVSAKFRVGAQGAVANFNLEDRTAMIVAHGGAEAWVPLRALVGFQDWGIGAKETAKVLSLSTGMSVKITDDRDSYEQQCGFSGVDMMLAVGRQGTVKDFKMKDVTAKLDVGGKESWVPIRALAGFEQWSGNATVTEDKPKEIKVEKGMKVKITADEKLYEKLCDANGIIAMISAGDTGTLKEVANDGTALVATKDGEGWVPIKALVGFADYSDGDGELAKPKRTAKVTAKEIVGPVGASVPFKVVLSKSSWILSSCQRTTEEYVKDAYTLALGMTVSKCFDHCRSKNGMKYFAVGLGRECICSQIPPGRRISSKHCDSRCSGNAKEICGGVAKAVSVYTMIDCAPRSPQKQKQIIASKEAQLVNSYHSFDGEGCVADEDKDVAELNGSSGMSGTPEECKLACWQAKGADVCHGFTYNKMQSKCTFHTDVSDVGERAENKNLSCHFKKLGGSPYV